MVVPLADRIPVTPPAPWAMAAMTINIDGDGPPSNSIMMRVAGCSSSMPPAQITCPSCQATLNLCVGVALTPGGAADDESSSEPPSGNEIGGKGQNGHRAMATKGRPGPTGSPEHRARPGQALLEGPRATDAQTLQPNYVTRRRR